MTMDPREADDQQLLLRLEGLLTKLEKLRQDDPELQLFGALTHGYELNPVLTEEEIAGFERKLGVRLPAEYRLFLLAAGNGGAGPFYGISKLATWHPELYLLKMYVEFEGGKPKMKDGKPVMVDLGPGPEIERPADPSLPFSLDGPWPGRGERSLPGGGAHPFDGCTHLAEEGDGYRAFLVINGARAGEVWEDVTVGAAFDAVRPTGLSFFAWYEQWLDDPSMSARKGP